MPKISTTSGMPLCAARIDTTTTPKTVAAAMGRTTARIIAVSRPALLRLATSERTSPAKQRMPMASTTQAQMPPMLMRAICSSPVPLRL